MVPCRQSRCGCGSGEVGAALTHIGPFPGAPITLVDASETPMHWLARTHVHPARACKVTIVIGASGRLSPPRHRPSSTRRRTGSTGKLTVSDRHLLPIDSEYCVSVED